MKKSRLVSWNGYDRQLLDEVLDVLRRGELLVLPTDTVYGLAADPRVPGAAEKLCRAKRRPADKPLPLLAASLAAVTRWPARFGPTARALAGRFWPGALTLVLDTPGAPEGFRVPRHPAALAVLRAAGGILRVTSANLSGHPPALTAAAAARVAGAALVLDAGPAPGGRPSTVVRMDHDRVIILRAGAIPASAIRAASRAVRQRHRREAVS